MAKHHEDPIRPCPREVPQDKTSDCAQPLPVAAASATLFRIVVIGLGLMAFLYLARQVVLPVVLACVAGMTLKPLIRWASCCRIPPALSAVAVLLVLVAASGTVFFQLGRPALTWMNTAPQHMADLRQRVRKMIPRIARFSLAAEAVKNLGASEAEQEKAPTIEVNDSHRSTAFISWTGGFLAEAGETLVVLYLLLASGDLFSRKLVDMMPTMQHKKRAAEINREIQQNISKYLFAVSVINICMGVVVGAGLFLMGVPNALMWGMLVAILNFVPYFGPVAGIILLATVGLLTFDTLWAGLLPPAWYLLLHLLEANLVTPVVLGRRFTLNPVVIFVSLIFWTWLWGVPGALLSVPILVSIKVVCDHAPITRLCQQIAHALSLLDFTGVCVVSHGMSKDLPVSPETVAVLVPNTIFIDHALCESITKGDPAVKGAELQELIRTGVLSPYIGMTEPPHPLLKDARERTLAELKNTTPDQRAKLQQQINGLNVPAGARSTLRDAAFLGCRIIGSSSKELLAQKKALKDQTGWKIVSGAELCDMVTPTQYID